MNLFEIILFIVITAGGVVYFSACVFSFYGYLKSHKKNNVFSPAVSVIIAARNEEKNIGLVLDDLIKQDYPGDKLEIVVVDDCSEDGTPDVVRKYISKDNRIKLTDTRNSSSPYSHKKKAVYEGIKSSTGEIIVTTDADVRIGSGWLRGKIKYFDDKTDLVAGDVIITGETLLGGLEALEMTGIQAMSAGLMNAGFPVTCNGANLAYRRRAFEKAGGFDGVGRVVSGDDDLLMQKISFRNHSGVVYISGYDNAVFVNSAENLGDFISRRTRWASKIIKYPSKAAVALLTFFFLYFTALLVWFCAAVIGISGFLPFVIGYMFKAAGDLLLTFSGALKMKRKGLMFLFPLAEIVHLPYIIFVVFKAYFGSFEWRGRKVKAV